MRNRSFDDPVIPANIYNIEEKKRKLEERRVILL